MHPGYFVLYYSLVTNVLHTFLKTWTRFLKTKTKKLWCNFQKYEKYRTLLIRAIQIQFKFNDMCTVLKVISYSVPSSKDTHGWCGSIGIWWGRCLVVPWDARSNIDVDGGQINLDDRQPVDWRSMSWWLVSVILPVLRVKIIISVYVHITIECICRWHRSLTNSRLIRILRNRGGTTGNDASVIDPTGCYARPERPKRNDDVTVNDRHGMTQ